MPNITQVNKYNHNKLKYKLHSNICLQNIAEYLLSTKSEWKPIKHCVLCYFHLYSLSQAHINFDWPLAIFVDRIFDLQYSSAVSVSQVKLTIRWMFIVVTATHLHVMEKYIEQTLQKIFRTLVDTLHITLFSLHIIAVSSVPPVITSVYRRCFVETVVWAL